MNIDVRSVAIRFADLWAIDPHQMVEEIYAVDIEMENMANPNRVVLGHAQLHAVEDRLSALIPDHRHELVRVIVGGEVACLETTVVSPTTGEYAPVCLWWWLDETGKVAAEAGWFDWEQRTTDCKQSHGTVPPTTRSTTVPPVGSSAQSRSTALARDYAARWAADPTGLAVSMFAADCTFGRVGQEEHRGTDALRDSREHELRDLPLAERWMNVHRVVGEENVVAMLVTLGNVKYETRGTVLLTLGDDGLVISERSYLDWAKAVPRGGGGRRVHVGSPGWTVRGR